MAEGQEWGGRGGIIFTQPTVNRLACESHPPSGEEKTSFEQILRKLLQRKGNVSRDNVSSPIFHSLNISKHTALFWGVAPVPQNCMFCF